MSDYRSVRTGKKRKKAARESRKCCLSGLFWAVLLFAAVIVGKQVYPEQLVSAWGRVVQALDSSVDLRGVFAKLGGSLTREGGALEGLEQFCVEVFGPQQREEEGETVQKTAVFRPIFPAARSGVLTGELERQNRIFTAEPTVLEEPEETVPAVGTVLIAGEDPQQELPEGYTGDKLSFGDLNTVSPVVGYLNSPFGYRDHPVNGKYSFHSGADISANAGDPIGAFADGVVEYVGEDQTYGRYLQLDHGDGIKSFYAHCREVCVRKGQRVTAGEKVAVVGATGRATGPHLHLELKCCGLRVDPAYYVDFL